MAAPTDYPVTALVTGGAGFIGSHLVDCLLERGHRVLCVDNFLLGKPEHLEPASRNPAFSLHEFDLLDVSALDALFGGHRIDIVYHLAANSDIREGTKSTDRDLKLTFLTTYNVLECMRRHSVPRILFTSTAAIFEQRDQPLSESAVVGPVSLYGASKLASEGFLTAFVELYGIQAWVCRFPNVVGERGTHGIIFDLLNKLATRPESLEVLGDGRQCKPYMYVHDLIDALLFILQHSQERLNVFNIGPADCARVAEIAQIVLEEAGAHQTLAFTGGARGWSGDVPVYRYDSSRLQALGWTPPRTSVEAVRLAVRRTLETTRGVVS